MEMLTDSLLKRIAALEARMATLEGRVAAVERHDALSIPPVECPACGSSRHTPCAHAECPYAYRVTCAADGGSIA